MNRHQVARTAPSSSTGNNIGSKKRLVAFSILAGCVFLARWNATSVIGTFHPGAAAESRITNSSGWKPAHNVGPNLCKDPDDDGDDDQPTHICRCTDPTIPIPGNHYQEWIEYHERLVEHANVTSNNNLDLVLLGDSLIERWNGTGLLGRQPLPSNRRMFDSFFTKSGNGTLNAIALGASADKATNLLWHLQHDMLPPTLQPKVWLVLIGTNDLGFAHCSKQSTLKAILHVTTYLQQQRPQSKILLHGLLPRGEGRQGGIMTLGKTWQDIQWINQQLQQACYNNKNNWYYMDTGTLFLNTDGTRLMSQYIADGIHPRLTGMRQWGSLIVQHVEQILSDDIG